MIDSAEILNAILTELRILNAREHARRPLTHADHLTLSRLLPALVGRYGSAVFTAKELTRDPTFRTLTGGMLSRELGTLFSKAARLDIDGRSIERVGADHNAALWKITSSD